MRFLTNILAKAGLIVDGTTQLNTIANAAIDTDKFLVSDGGVIKYRTGAELASDLGSLTASTLKHQVKLGEAIAKGQAVYVSSADGTNMIVSKASNATEATSSKTLGLIETGGALNAQVNVITEGLLAGLDTSTATAGDPVWLGTNGNLIFGLINKPSAPAHLVFIGIVTRAQSNNGEIFVKVQNGFELQELHNVAIASIANKDLLMYEAATSLWKNKTLGTVIGGVSTQYVKGDGTLGSFPDIGGGGGLVYYLNGSIASGVAGYSQMSRTPVLGAGTDFSKTGNGLICQFLTDANDPSVLSVPSGAWRFGLYASMSTGGNSSKFYVEVYKYDGTTFTLIGTSSGTPESVTNGTATEYYTTTVAMSTTALTVTDRIAVKIYATDNNTRTMTIHTENSHLCDIATTFPTGISAINGLITPSQYLSTTTTGTDFTISSSSNTHYFNLPVASATVTGKLSSTDWSTFNSKQNALGYTPVNQTRTLTINGVSYDLTADRTWSVGTVTSVGVSVPTGFTVSNSPVISSGTIAITFTAGYSIPTTASQSNWDTAYNNRITSLTTTGTSGAATLVSNTLNIPQYQAQGSYITSLTGEATASGPGSASVTLTNSAVIGKILTGLNVTGGTVLATDSILTAFGKLQNQVNGLAGGVTYQGVWDASANSPSLTSSVGTKGYYYVVSVAGSTNLNGITDWKLGDWVIFNGNTWEKVDNTDAVVSVNGFTGAVSLTTTNIAEGTNLYYTDTRARAAISLTTTGSSGAATYSGGVLNVPQYTLAGLGGVPSNRTLTINGTAYDLSADRTWTISVPVSSVSGSGAGISVSPTTGAVVISNTGVTSLNGSTGAITGIATTAQLANYLPLAGGTMTGDIIISNQRIKDLLNTNKGVYIGNWGGAGYWGLGSASGTHELKLDQVDVNGVWQSATDVNLYLGTRLVLNSSNYNSYSPTLTGGGASGTWGINITGSASSATNADTVDGYHASTSTIGNYIVVRDGNGYIFGNYINMTDDGNPGGGTAISSFITKQGDNYYRSVSPTNAMVSIRGVASGTWSINITGSAGSASSASSVPWTGVSSGTRTNYDLGFAPPDGSSSYAGFYFSTPGSGGSGNAGYFLVRGGADNDVYTQNGITLVADAGWLTLAQRTQSNKGVRIMTGSASTTRLQIDSSGNIDVGLGAGAVTLYHGGSARFWTGSDGTRTQGWSYYQDASVGMHWPSNQWHLMPASASDFRIHSGSNTDSALRFETNGTTRGYVYAENDNTIGFLTNSRNWAFRTYSNGNALVYGYLTVNGAGTSSSIYMNDTDNGQREIHCNSDRIGFLTQAGNWGAWLHDGADWEAASSVRAPIFYDSQNTGYYLDPSSTGTSLYVAGSVQGSYYVASNYGSTGYTQYKGYDNNNHFIMVRGKVTGNTTTPTYAGYHRTSLVEYAEANDDTGWFFQTAATGNYDIVARITRSYSQFEGSVRAPIFYDSQDTGYYLDPNGTSNLNTWTSDTAARIGRSRYWTNRWAIYGTANDYMTGTNGWAMDHGGWGTAWKGGFSGWDIWGTGTDHPQGSGYVHAQGIISGQHAASSDGSSAYGWMMVGAHNATENRYWLRGKWSTSTSGWVEMITTGNIGSQSVSYASSAGNADTVDGFHAAAFPYRSGGSSGYYQVADWMQFNTSAGLYWPSYYNAHVEPNTFSSYGSINIRGSKNGWAGINFSDSDNNLMANSNESGFHKGGYGWQFRWTEGTLYCHKNSYGGGTSATVWDSVNAPRAANSNLMYYQGFTLDANTMDSNSTGFTYSVNAPTTGPVARFSTGGGYDLWLNAAYSGGGTVIYFRTRNGDAGTNNSWRRILNDGYDPYAANMNQYVRTSDNVEFNQVYVRGSLYVGTWQNSSDIFMTDGDEGTRQIHCNSNRIGFLTQAGNWGAWLYDGADWEAASSVRAPIFYDSQDTNYYGDFAGTSKLNTVDTFQVRNIYGVSTDHQFGIFFGNGDGTAYAIYRESGTWTHPYPDLRISFHTGIKLGANANYNGIRFYDDYTMVNQVMSVNNASDGLGANNVYVNNSLVAGSSLRAPIFYDSNDTTYYADFANSGTSIYTAGIIRSSGVQVKGSSGGGQIYPTMSNGGVSLYGGNSFTNGAYFTVTGIDYGSSPGAGSAEFVIRSEASSKFALFSYNGSTWTGRYGLFGATGNVTIGDANTDIGYRLYVIGDIYATGNVIAYSDARVKTNVREIENPLARVLNTRGVMYDRTDNEEKDSVGFIAQELEKEFPELVSTSTDGRKGVKYQNMVAVLVEAMKEQNKEIQKLKLLINGASR